MKQVLINQNYAAKLLYLPRRRRGKKGGKGKEAKEKGEMSGRCFKQIIDF